MIKISVCMACYNERDQIVPTLENIVSNCCSFDYEIIIVDDRSSDGSLQLLELYSEKNPRIKVFNNDINSGLAFCLNRAILACTSGYIFRVDFGDLSISSRFQDQVAFMEMNPSVDVYGGGIIINAVEETIFVPAPEVLSLDLKNPFRQLVMHHPTVLFRSSFFERFGLYDISLRRAQDKEIWIRSLKKGAVIKNDGKALVEYSGGSGAKSFKNIAFGVMSIYRISMMHALPFKYRNILIFLAKQLYLKVKVVI